MTYEQAIMLNVVIGVLMSLVIYLCTRKMWKVLERSSRGMGSGVPPPWQNEPPAIKS